MSTIPNARPITVNNQKFRYSLRGKSRFIGNTPEVFLLTVQSIFPGKVLQAHLVSKILDEHEIDDIYPTHKASVHPQDVAKVIQEGLVAGWNPSHKSGSFLLEKDIELKEYRVQKDT